MRTAPSRSGAALIIALVVLAALLLLGLPFLFTQSSSLAGTRSFAHSQQALIGRASAENVGVAAASSAMDYHWRSRFPAAPSALDEWTSLYRSLGGGSAQSPEIRPLSDGRTGIDLRIPREKSPGVPLDPLLDDSTLSGVSITDEHGKLDPNYLDSSAWTRLLGAVGIADWDDGTPPTPDAARNQLARALTDLRFNRTLIPDGRITRFDQLLLAEPPPSTKPRHGLTRAELAQLVPHLSLHGMAQARSGLIDLGTVINVIASDHKAMLDSLSPGGLLAHPVFPTLIGPGSVIIDAFDDGSSTGVSQVGTPLISSSMAKDRALAIDAPPPVNLHEASAVVRKVLLDVPAASWPASPPFPAPPTTEPTPSTLTALAALGPPGALTKTYPSMPMEKVDELWRPRTSFDLLDPLGIIQVLGQTLVLPSQQSPNESASGPFRPGDLLSYEPLTGRTTLDAGVSTIRIKNGPLDRFPYAGYARIEGTTVSNDPMNPIGGAATEYVFYRSSDLPTATGSTQATLSSVVRGLPLPPGSGGVAYRFFTDSVTLTILNARELPPLAIASPGIVTVETAATATDPAGRQTAQQARTVVAQTVAQEYPLEARWERQSQFHATLAQRQGSLLASFPEAVDRVQGRLPQEVPPSTPPSGADPYFDQRIGVRPAVLRSPMNGSHLFPEWTAPLAGRETGNDALRGGPQGGQAPAFVYTLGDLFPEGLRLSTARRLAWPFAPSTNDLGFFNHPSVTDGTTREILPRQLGFWVRPDASWAGRTEPVVLFEVRGPIANAGLPLLGTTAPDPMADPAAVTDKRLSEGSTSLQNYLGLMWYPGSQEFVLAIGTGAIEHVADYGPAVPSDNYAITTVPTESKSPSVDNSSLGIDPMGRYYPLAPARLQNRIEHRYHFDAAFLRPGTWHLIQVAFSGTRPDHASIMVDGLVGRRVDESAAATTHGDHYAMPRLTLATALAPTHQGFGMLGASVYRVDAIELTGPADQVLPKRGMIRIGSEYISYQRLTGNTLQNCWRARRQDSISGTTPATTEAHAIGDEVYPGGYHTTVPTLYTGGNTLAQPLSNGDVTVGSLHPHRVWANLARAPIYPPVPLSTDFILPKDETSIILSGNALLIDQFPPSGYAMIDSDEVFFFTRAAGSNALVANRWQPVPNRTAPVPADRVCNSMTTIYLVSAELVGPDPTVPPVTTVPPAPSRFPPSGLLQLYDANGTAATHRAEWVQYQAMINRSGVSYVLNYSGFDDNQRGQLRTAFAARDLADTTFFFPTGTRVLPVQSGNRFAETGDVLTVARQQLSKLPGQQPWQSVVRFAEKDGWGSPNAMTGVIPVADPVTGRPFDGSNNHFAFCEAVPEHFVSQASCHLLCWPGWNGERDLSSTIDLTSNPNANLTNVTTHDLLPWGNAWAKDVLNGVDPITLAISAITDDRRVCIGSDDHDPNTPRLRISVPGTPTIMAIDALWSGSQVAAGNISLQVTGIISATPVDIELPWINGTALSDASSIELQANGTLFPSQGRLYVLAMIGGEVFALEQRLDTLASPNVYRQDQARIVGRALMGSAARVHRGKEPVLILPLGPVTPLTASLSPIDQNAAPFAALDAPAVMIMDADGSSTSKPELLTAPNGWVAPWLRGMYGTPIGTWTVASGSPAPLAVGWWPRYPSAMPVIPDNSLWPTGIQRNAWINAMFRSRSYAWAGFPLRFHNAAFYATGTNGARSLVGPNDFLGAQIDVIDDADGLYQIEARALDAGFDWQASPIVQHTMLGVLDASDVFLSDRFRRPSDGVFRSGVAWRRNDPIPVDGAELRITWSTTPSAATTMQGALLDLARQNRAPMIGPVRLRCQASSQVLSVEAAR